MFLDPVTSKRKEPIVNNPATGNGPTSTPKKPIVGEYIEYEEIK
jgi:hypothetical protein